MAVASWWRHVRQRIFRLEPLHALFRISVVLLFLFLVYVILFQSLENVSWEESFWQGWQTFTTVGYGNKPAGTLGGRLVTIFLATTGIAILGGVFSAAFDLKHYFQEMRRFGMADNRLKDGYVIFNFPGTYKMITFIDELRAVEKNVGVCIVDSRLDQLPDQIAIMNNIHFISGSILNQKVYKQASINSNKAVIVFPTESAQPTSDGATKTVIELLEQSIKPDVRMIHILVDPGNSWMFENTRSTQILESFEILATVQECQDPYSAGIAERLFQNSAGADPQTVTPKEVIGWSWGKFVQATITTGQREGIRCNPFALISDREADTCPDWAYEIKEGDMISMITYPGFSWKQFEEKLVSSQKKSN